MGTIDAQGIYKYASNDVVAPLEAALNVGQQSVSDAFANLGPGTIRYAANAAARNALAASYAPSATKPLFVYRGDAPAGKNLEFTLDGSNWGTYSDNRDVTGWTAVTAASGINSFGEVRRIRETAHFRGQMTKADGGTWSPGVVTLGTVSGTISAGWSVPGSACVLTGNTEGGIPHPVQAWIEGLTIRVYLADSKTNNVVLAGFSGLAVA